MQTNKIIMYAHSDNICSKSTKTNIGCGGQVMMHSWIRGNTTKSADVRLASGVWDPELTECWNPLIPSWQRPGWLKSFVDNDAAWARDLFVDRSKSKIACLKSYAGPDRMWIRIGRVLPKKKKKSQIYTLRLFDGRMYILKFDHREWFYVVSA